MIYSLWWLFWSFIAFIGLGEIVKPSLYTIEIVFVLIFFMWVGYFFKEILPTKKDAVYFSLLSFNESFLLVLKATSKFILIFSIPIVFYFSYRGISLLNEYGPVGYRNSVYSRPGEPSLLFGSEYFEVLYNAIISPMILFSLFSSLTIFFYENNKKYLSLSFLLGFLDSIMMLGRFYLYIFIVLIIIGSILIKKNKILFAKIFSIVLVVFMFIISITYVRYQDLDSEVNIVDTVIKTHTVGFVLFDKELNNQNSDLNKNMTYGRATFGGIDWYINLILRRFIPDYQIALNSTSRDEFIDVSTTTDDQLFNAYYTLLYTVYSDFRMFGVICFGAITGFMIRKNHDDFLMNKNPSSFVFFMIMSYVFIFSIFNSPLESMKVWGAVFIYLFVIRKAKLFCIYNVHG